MPASLRSPTSRSLGHFSSGRTPATSSHARRRRERHRLGQALRLDDASEVPEVGRQQDGDEERGALGRLPTATEPAPAGGLVVGHQDGAEGRPRPGHGQEIGVRRTGRLHTRDVPGRRDSGALPGHGTNIPIRCSPRSSSPTGAKSPSGSSAPAASSASRRSPCTPISIATPCTSGWPTRPTPSAGRRPPRATSTPRRSSTPSPRSAPTACTPATASTPRTPTSPGRVTERGVAFIGPPPEAIEAMGDKISARIAAERADVPGCRATTDLITDPAQVRSLRQRPRLARRHQGRLRRAAAGA